MGDYTHQAYPDILKLAREHKVNYIFAHYPAKDNTNYLSEVGYCVYNEYGEKFWPFNDYLFTVDKINIHHQEYMDEILKNFDFDPAKINQCVNDQKTKDVIKKQIEELKKTNIYGTPTLFINGRAFVGPKPYRVYLWELIKFW